MEALKESIKAIFEASQHQQEALVGIYKLYVNDWERIRRIHGWPKCGRKMWLWTCEEFVSFDRQHHPDVVSGGLWMDNGFSCSTRIGDWEVSLENCSFEYQ